MNAALLASIAILAFPIDSGTPFTDPLDSTACRTKVFPDGWVFKLPLLDYPSNFTNGYSPPSMDQSLYLSKGVAQSAHWGIGAGMRVLWEKPLENPTWWKHYLARLTTVSAIVCFDMLYNYIPPGYAWLHEEFHRAVMSNRGISSYNDVYNFKLFASSISVSHVADSELVRLKRDYPADMVRLHEAGIEGEHLLAIEMQRDCFFLGKVPLYDIPGWWFNALNSILYVRMCSRPVADTVTDEANIEDGPDVERRDFTGLDFTAWVYDLYRPDEPYTQRGAHPSGVGIDRYIRYSDLTAEELRFLALNGNLAFLNLASPVMLGFTRFEATDPFTKSPFFWNVSLGHDLTSFGYTLDANLLLKEGLFNWFLTVHNYVSPSRYFPGIEVGLCRFPVTAGALVIHLSPRILVWTQPSNQRYDDTDALPGGMLSLEASLSLGRHVELFLSTSAKTRGWVAGNVHLDEALAVSAGINLKPNIY